MHKAWMANAAFGVLALAAAASASAQSAIGRTGATPGPSAAQPAGTAPAASVQEVVVTAERREQSSQKVDISMTVLSPTSLVDQNITTVNQLQNASPNLEVEPAFGSGQPQFRIRGVGFQDYASNNAPTVGIYINEVAYPIPIMTQGSFFDIARVEVLRGPQGTLYGRNTTGGAVNIITNQPTADWHEGAEVEYGSYDWLHAEAYVSGPLAAGVTSRLALMTEQGGGYQFNRDTGQAFGDVHHYGARWITDWEPDAHWLAKLELHGFYDYSAGQGLYLFAPSSFYDVQTASEVTIPADANHYATGWNLDPTFASFIGAAPGSAPFRHNAQDGASLNVRYRFDGADIVNIVSYDFMNRRELEDWGAIPQEVADVFFHTRSTVVSDELRAISNTNGPLSWIGGAYVSYQGMNEAYLSDFLDVYGISAGVHYTQHVYSEAVFGQAEYRFSDQLKLTGGLRFENEDRYLENFQSQYLFGTAPVGGLPPSNVSTSMKPLTGKVALEYTPMSNVLLYTSVSRGVKSGGFTTYNTGAVAGISAFAPEKLWAYEGGFKWTIRPGLRFDGAGFYYDYTDQQVLSALYTPGTVANPTPTIIGHFVNAPKSHIDGFEASLEGEILPHLTFSQQIGWKEGYYDTFTEFNLARYEETGVAGLSNMAGQPIPFPHWSYEGSIGYSFPVGAGLMLEPEGDWSFHGYYPSWLGSQFDVPAYWLANLNLTLTPENRHWSVGLWIHNLFDQQYDLTRNFFISGINVAAPGRPRSVGARLSVNF